MRKLGQAIHFVLIPALVVMVMPGCKKPCKTTQTITYYKPVYKSKNEVKDNIKNGAPRPIVNPGKVYQYGHYMFLNEVDKGIHVIDNTNPSAPVNVAFIALPGNMDMVAKNNLLYADFYTDMVVLDITQPLQVTTRNFVNKVFPMRDYGIGQDGGRIIDGWEQTTATVVVDCDNNKDAYSLARDLGGVLVQNPTVGAVVPFKGSATSLARFALINNYLYTVSNNSLVTFSLAAPNLPNKVHTLNLPWGVETIYPFRGTLFIGAADGMHICDLQNPSQPVHTSTFSHAESCDPVIADGNIAFVTLRSGNICGGNINQLDVIDVTNIYFPKWLKTYPLTNPMGMGKDGNLLFVCDGNSGVRVYNAADPLALLPITQLPIPKATDIIVHSGIALIISPSGLHQYDYTNPNQIKWLSTIPLNK